MSGRTLKKLSLAFPAALTAAALAAPGAQAGPLVASANCGSKPVDQVFMPWADPANYFLATSGTFEGGAKGWTLNGAADEISRNEPWEVSGNGTRALSIPAGANATSAVECVGLTEPTLRFFARGPLLGALTVTVVFEDALGNVQRTPAGVLAGTGSWTPGIQMPIVAALLPLLPGEQTPVRFEFRATSGSWQIDDVYVDPYRRT